MVVYKVVRRDGEFLVSCAIGPDARVIYVPGEWTKPPGWLEERGYLLTAFESQVDAERFCDALFGQQEWLGNYEIWEAEAGGRIIAGDELPPWCIVVALVGGEARLWGSRAAGAGKTLWPQGTLMAERLRLVKRRAAGQRNRTQEGGNEWRNGSTS